jgi:hypothetical protein
MVLHVFTASQMVELGDCGLLFWVYQQTSYSCELLVSHMLYFPFQVGMILPMKILFPKLFTEG